MKIITVKLNETLGCNVAATAFLKSLRQKFPHSRIQVYTKYPDLIKGSKSVNDVFYLNKKKLKRYNVNFWNYLKKRKPQEWKPLRHLITHMKEIAESDLNIKLKENLKPEINLTKGELIKAKKILNEFSEGKPLIWLQTKTREKKKDLPNVFWKELIKKNKNFRFIFLSPKNYSRRISIAITKLCKMGVTLDTFLLHGSEAANAKNTITIMVDSHAKVVSYKDQIVIKGSKSNWKNTLKKVNFLIKKMLSG